MPGLALAMTVDKDTVVAQAKAERRRFRRVPIDIRGKIFVPGDERDGSCRIIDLSPGGAQVACELGLPAGTPIVLYVDGFGRFEGVVARPVDAKDQTDGNFGIKFHCSALKRERVAEQLTVFLNKGVVDESAMRRHDREPTKGLARFTRANGDIVGCEVLDLSLSGVSLKSDVKPPIGEVVLIGQMAGRVARHHETGVAIEFVGSPHERSDAERIQTKLSVVR
jgi:PilZ domain